MHINHYILLQIVSQGILKYCLKGCLGENQRYAVFKFIDICTKLFAEKQTPDVTLLIEEVNITLAHLEKYMPVTIQVHIHTYVAMC